MKKALIFGGSGFLGHHLRTELASDYEVVSLGSDDCDLMDINETIITLRSIKPDYIFHLAAYVGGIGLNKDNPAKMFHKNMQMGINILEAHKDYPECKLIVVGTVCSYPKYAEVPFKEDNIWNGYPEETNAPYGIAKKALLVMGQSYAKQYGSKVIFAIPSNLYGTHDNFDRYSSHVIPAMIDKIHEAKTSGLSKVTLWGTGTPTREFLNAKDCASALAFLAKNYDDIDPVNIAVNNDISIKDLAQKISNIVEFDGTIEWDKSKPDGQPRRRVDNSRLLALGYNEPFTPLDDGLRETYEWFRTSDRKVH